MTISRRIAVFSVVAGICTSLVGCGSSEAASTIKAAVAAIDAGDVPNVDRLISKTYTSMAGSTSAYVGMVRKQWADKGGLDSVEILKEEQKHEDTVLVVYTLRFEDGSAQTWASKVVTDKFDRVYVYSFEMKQ